MDKLTLINENHKVIELLYELRELRGLRQVDLADKLHVHQSFISKYESGERRLDFVEVRLICKVFGISMVDFCEQLEKKIDGSRR